MSKSRIAIVAPLVVVGGVLLVVGLAQIWAMIEDFTRFGTIEPAAAVRMSERAVIELLPAVAIGMGAFLVKRRH